jgi:small GTP-binding protein
MTDFNYKIYKYNNEYYKVQIWDIAGQDRSIGTTKILVKDAHACLIFSDITNRKTLDDTLKWKNAVDEKAKFKDDSPLPCVLIQNKIDLVSNDVINDDAFFNSFSNKNKFLKCFRTSVKKNIGVNEVMDYIIGHVVEKLNIINVKVDLPKISDTHPSIFFRLSNMSQKEKEELIKKNNCCVGDDEKKNI